MAQTLIDGLGIGIIYAVVALGMLLIFNAVRIVNFAQGQLLMLGSYFGVTFVNTLQLPTWLAYSLSILVMMLFGIIFMLVTYFPLRGKPPYLVILTTIAMGIILENLVLIFWGPMPRALPSPIPSTFDLGIVVISGQIIFTFIITAILLVAQYLLTTKTLIGLKMQATSQDMVMARLVGVRVNYTICGAFMLSCAFATIAGLLITPTFLAETTMGTMLGLKGFVVSVIGGFGNIPGAIIGGLLLGLLEMTGARYISSDFRDAYAFVALIAVLFFYPQGIFGEKISERI
jgi:branched-chain amino acid transport system permease protein